MLQVKIWSFNLYKVKGNVLEGEVNKFLKKNTIVEDTFEMFLLEHGIMVIKVLYKVRKKRE